MAEISAFATLDAGQIDEYGSEFEQARTAFEKAVEVDSKPGMLSNLANFLANCPHPKLRDPERAASIISESIENPSPEVNRKFRKNQLTILGISRYRHGNWDEAIEAFEKSDSAEGLYFIAMCHWHSGKRELAIDTFNKAAAKTKEDYEARDEWSPDDDRESDRYRHEAAELLGIPEAVGDIDKATQ